MTVHTCFREQSRTFFGMIALLLLTMVILTATVGSVGLTGALSINVIERRREIGVLRALGTTRAAILAQRSIAAIRFLGL